MHRPFIGLTVGSRGSWVAVVALTLIALTATGCAVSTSTGTHAPTANAAVASESSATPAPSGREALAAAQGQPHVLWFWGAH